MPDNKLYLTVDGKQRTVNKETFDEWGAQKYADAYKGATIRMRDNEYDYAIPLSEYDKAVKSGLRPFLGAHYKEGDPLQSQHQDVPGSENVQAAYDRAQLQQREAKQQQVMAMDNRTEEEKMPSDNSVDTWMTNNPSSPMYQAPSMPLNDNALNRHSEFIAQDQRDNEYVDNEFEAFKPFIDESIEQTVAQGRDKAADYMRTATGGVQTMQQPGQAFVAAKEFQREADYSNVLKKVNQELEKIYGSDAVIGEGQENQGGMPDQQSLMREKMFQRAYNYLVEKNVPAGSIEYILTNAFTGSGFGFFNQIGKSPEQLAIEAEANEKYGANWAEKGLAGAGSIVLDAPIFAITGGAGAVGAEATINAVVGRTAKQMIAKGVSQEIAMGAAKRLVYANVPKMVAARITAGAVSGGINFAGYDAIKDVMNQSIQGEGFDVGQTAKATLGGFGKGALFGIFGTAAAHATRNLTGVARVAGQAGTLVGEIGMFTGIGVGEQLMHGATWEDIDLGEEALVNTAMILALKAKHPSSFLNSKNKVDENGRVLNNLKFTREQVEELQRAGYNVENTLGFIINTIESKERTARENASKEGVFNLEGLSPAEPFVAEYEKIMNNPDVSQSLKAKMMYLVEGKLSSTPPLMASYRVEPREDGGGSLVTYDAMNRVIERKTFRTEEDAREYARKNQYDHKGLVNKVLVAEKMNDRFVDDIYNSAVLQVYSDANGIPVEMISEVIGKRAKGEELTKAEAAMLNDIRAAKETVYYYIRNISTGIAESIKEETGINPNEAVLKKTRSEQEQVAIDKYIERLTKNIPADRLKGESEGAWWNVVSPKILEGHFEQKKEEGKKKQTPEEMHEAKNALDKAKDDFVAACGEKRFEDLQKVIERESGDPAKMFDHMKWQQWNDKEIEAAMKYIAEVKVMDGVQQTVSQTVEQTVAEANKSAEDNSNKATGRITRVSVLTQDGMMEGYMINGRFEVDEDGSVVSVDNILYFRNDEGKVYQVSAKDIKQIVSDTSLQDVIGSNETELREKTEKEMQDQVNYAPGIPNPQQEQVINVEGVDYVILEVTPEGRILLLDRDIYLEVARDTNKLVKAGLNEGFTITMDEYNELMTDVIDRGEEKPADETLMQKPSEVTEQDQGNDGNAPQVGQDEPQTALSRIPTNEKGEPSFEQAPVQDTWAAMMEMTNGVEDEALDNVRSYIEQLNTDLEKAKKKKPAGSSIMEIQASKEEKKATIKDIQDRIKYWNAVIESQEPVVLTDKKRKLGYRFSKDEALLGDPLSVREAILRDIATGRIRFMWGDVDGGSKGLASHMGFTGSEAERKKRFWALSKDGMSPEHASEVITENLVGLANVEQQDVFNEILEIMRKYDKPSDMWDEVMSLHEDISAIENGDEFDNESFEDYFHREYGVSVEEMDEITEHNNKILSSYDKREIDNIFAEINKDNDVYGQGNGSAAPTQGSGQPIAGGVDEPAEQNIQVLQGKEPAGISGQEVRPEPTVPEMGVSGGDANADAGTSTSSSGTSEGTGRGQLDDYTPADKAVAERRGKQIDERVAAIDKEIANTVSEIERQKKQLGKRVSTEAQGDLFGKPKGDGELFGAEEIPIDYSGDNIQAALKPLNDKVTLLEQEKKALQEGREKSVTDAVEANRAQMTIQSDEDVMTYAERLAQSQAIDSAAADVNTNPSEAQKEAGNYKKGHVNIDGMDVTIENPKGSVRSGVDANGESWSITMNNDYGYIRRTEGADGEQVDVFFGNTGNKVFVVDQVNKDGSFDEHKVMYGFNSLEEAKAAYLSNYEEGWQGLGAINEVEDFKGWLKDGDLTRPFAVEEKNIQRYREAAAEISKIFNEPFEGTDKELIEAVDRMAKLFDDYLGGKIKAGEFQDAIGVDLSNKKDVALLDELAESLHRNGFLEKEDKDNGASGNVSEIKPGEDVLDYATRLADEQSKKNELAEEVKRPSFLGEPYQKKHDKTGADIHIAPIKERVSAEVFNDMKQMAKESGGSYSNFISGKKSRTDVGFVFKTQEGLNKFLKKVSEAYLSENANDTRVDSSNDIELKSDEKFVGTIRQALQGGEKLNIVSIRKIAEESGLKADDIQLQELTEYAIISEAKEIARDKNLTQEQAYKKIVALYESQPTISMRSSGRIEKQQYSTPLPMSYMADMYVMRSPLRSVLEPSAGNGMMVFAIDPSIVHVNDIDADRRSNLEKQGFKAVTDQDALVPFGGDVYDAIVMNPPFGTLTAKRYGEYDVPGLAPQMALNALASMSDTGRAAIIIGGNTSYKSNGTLSSEKGFLNYLYDNYNVQDVINISGGLYAKQGTSFPTRMILINGRRFSDTKMYAPLQKDARAEPIKTFDELYERISLLPTEFGVSDREVGQQSIQQGRVQRDADASGRDVSGIGGKPSRDSQGQDADVVADRAKRQGGTEKADTGTGGGTTPVRTGGSADMGGQKPGSTTDTRRVEGGNEARGTQPADIPERSGELERAEVRIDATQEKTTYPTRSKSIAIGSVVPTNTAEPINSVLSKFEDIDAYVQDKLGYDTKDELYKALSAEQIDSVALGIQQIENGKAFIIGDMTGVGKGRQAAALLRYAVKKGMKPVFITEKAQLFSDIYRDLRDIGSPDMVPYIFNESSEAKITDEEGNVIYRPLSKPKNADVLSSGMIPDDCQFAIATYSQINPKGDTPKKALLSKLAENGIVIMDESHNAGGESNTGEYLRDVVASAKGVVFLSGTFAKKASNMPIYAIKTNMSDANMTQDELIEAISTGGVPLQEIMSKALVQGGQMIRRERDFTGVTIDWLPMEVDVEMQKEKFNGIIDIFNELIRYQRDYITPLIEDMNDALASQQGTAETTKGTKDMGVTNTPFASKTFNLVRQLLFSMKADEIADRAIAHLKEGHKPVIAVDNTMEGFIKDEMTENEDAGSADFSMTLIRGLEGLMRYTEKNAAGKSVSKDIPFSMLSPEGQKRYKELQKKIQEFSSGLSISPIDVIKNKMEAAGYRVGEMTGRNYEIRMNEHGQLVKMRRVDTDKKKTAREFNSGELDAVILNKSASTGISLHASTKFADQKQRVMIFAQNQLDVNTEVQMRGRIDRTGQVSRAMYEYIVSSIPAEGRMMMMFKAKLKSLDANTTSSQKSKINEMEIVDFLNKYGDQIVYGYVNENPELNEKLLFPLPEKKEDEVEDRRQKTGEGGVEAGFASKVAGRVALLKVEEQEQFYNDVAERYTNLINYLNDTGTNDLEITTLPLRAETKSSKVLVSGKDPEGDNPFASDTILEEVEVDVLKKPMRKDEIGEAISGFTQGKNAMEYRDDILATLDNTLESSIKAIDEQFDSADMKQKKLEEVERMLVKAIGKKDISDEKKAEARKEFIDDIEVKYDRLKERKKKLVENNVNQISTIMRMIPVGRVVYVPASMQDNNSSYSYGMLIGYRMGAKMTPSTITAVFATLDGRRKIEIPLSKKTFFDSVVMQTRMFGHDIDVNMDNWDQKIPNKTRKKAYIVTGNVLQAYGTVNGGQLVSYTTVDGDLKQGILMPDNFSTKDVKTKKPIRDTYDSLYKREGEVVDTTGEVKITPEKWSYDYILSVPLSKQKGGKYFLDGDLRSLADNAIFYQKGNKMIATISRENLKGVLDCLTDRFGLTVSTKGMEDDSEVSDKGIRFREDREQAYDPFFSNAEQAVKQIKQEKATPEQWLKMIEKNGGLKAGEDKWMGLSDWLKENESKTLTKQEVLDFINSNKIEIEETEFSEYGVNREDAVNEMLSKMSREFSGLSDEMYNEECKRLEKEFESSWDNDDDNYYQAMNEYFEDNIDRESIDERADYAVRKRYGVEDFPLNLYDGYEIGDADFNELANVATRWKGYTNDVEQLSNSTRMHYTTEGLYNKKEIALSAPNIEGWNENDEIHFGDTAEGKVFAWIRFGETTDAEGTRVLVIDEIQSKRHQEGREKGYKNYKGNESELWDAIAESKRKINSIIEEATAKGNEEAALAMSKARFHRDLSYIDDIEGMSEESISLLKQFKEEYKNIEKLNEIKGDWKEGAIPTAPFEKNWPELCMKRMLRYAAENGFEKVAWTKGAQQAERYNIGKKINRLIIDEDEGVYTVMVREIGDTEMKELKKCDASDLPEIVGKELAKRAIDEGGLELSGQELRLGGEGMKGFYDSMLPSFMNKYGKKWGVKVGEVELPDVEEAGRTMWSVPVTANMRESVMLGQPMFRFIGEKGAANVDKAQESTVRLDNLNIARSMEKANKDAKVIKTATGWERGKDGLWRYETADFDLPKMNDEETIDAYVERASKEFAANGGNPNAIMTLERLLMGDERHNELFKEYPELERTALIPKDTNGRVTAAYIQFANSVIIASHLTKAEAIPILNHEIQHAIQEVEGFAKGGNAETVRASLHEAIERSSGNAESARQSLKRRDAIVSDIYKLEAALKLFKNPRSILKMSEQFQLSGSADEKQLIAKGQELASSYFWDVMNNADNGLYKDYFEFKNDYSKYENLSADDYVKAIDDMAKSGVQGSELLSKLKVALKDIDKEIKANDYKGDIAMLDKLTKAIEQDSDFKLYQKLAGETEARNVSARMNMTMDERRNSLAEETEDVAREDQIVLRDGFGMSMSEEANPIVASIERLSKELNTPINVITDVNQLPKGHEARKRIEAGRGVKGWYQNGKMFVYLPNAIDINDAKKTALHEIVGHHGLRELFGKSFDKELDNIYKYLPAETREYIRMEAEDKYKGDMHEAMDEYLADMAEADVRPSWWNRMLSSIRSFLRKLGIGIEMSDNDLAYLLWRSKRNLKDNDPIDVAKDIAMQMKMGVGEYGDAPLARDMEDRLVRFKIREDEPPKNTGVGYKVFYKGKDGNLYPPMVANKGGVDTPVGVWLDAEDGESAGVSKTGRKRVKAGGKGTKGGSGKLAYRPGWHLGEIPYAIQFNRRNPENGKKELFPRDFVWALVEYAKDEDYQEKAMSYGYNKKGKFQHSLAGLPYLPADGSYKYRTNPNPKTDDWIITGSMRVINVLTDEEVDDIVRAAGREPQKRQPPKQKKSKATKRKKADDIRFREEDTKRPIRMDGESIKDYTKRLAEWKKEQRLREQTIMEEKTYIESMANMMGVSEEEARRILLDTKNDFERRTEENKKVRKAIRDAEEERPGDPIGYLTEKAAVSGLTQAEKRAYQQFANEAGIDTSLDGLKRAWRDEIILRRRYIESNNLETSFIVNDIKKETSKKEREAIPYIIEGTYQGEVSDKLQEVVDKVVNWFDGMYDELLNNGVAYGCSRLDNYVTHIWDMSLSDADAVESYNQMLKMRSPYTKKRVITSLAEGISMGLVPKYTDITDIMQEYGQVATLTIANKHLMDFMKGVTIRVDKPMPASVRLMIPSDNIDADYVLIDNDTLSGYKVHRSMAHRVKTIFGSGAEWRRKSKEDMTIGDKAWKLYDMAGSAAKRITLSLSFFHAGALTESAVAAMNPVHFSKTLAKNLLWDALTKGQMPTMIDREVAMDAVKHMVQLGASSDYDAKDVGKLTGAIAKWAKHYRDTHPNIGTDTMKLLTDIVDGVNTGMDKFLWNYLHDSLKMYTYKKYADEWRAVAEKRKYSPETLDKGLNNIGQMINDQFGGQHWELLNITPGQLLVLKRILLSPDWNISTLRQFWALSGRAGLYDKADFDGSADPTRPFQRKKASMYWLTAMLFFGGLMNGLNAWRRDKDVDKEALLAEQIRKENPEYRSPYEIKYPDGMKWYDYTMFGNGIGKTSDLFIGRNDNGTELYARWGKQFREVIELIYGNKGFDVPQNVIDKLQGKANPVFNMMSVMANGQTLSGYAPEELREEEKKNAFSKWMGRSVYTATNSFVPWSVSDMIMPDQGKDWNAISLIMPTSKGMSNYKAKRLMEDGLISGNINLVESAYDAAVMNKLDADKLIKAAITSVEALDKKEYSDGITNVQEAVEAFDKEKNIVKKGEYRNKLNKMLSEADYKAYERDMAVEKALEYIDGITPDDKPSLRYSKLETSSDVRDEYAVSKIMRSCQKTYDKMQEMLRDGDEAAHEYAQANKGMIELYRRGQSVRAAVNKMKRGLGRGVDDVIMGKIRETRRLFIDSASTNYQNSNGR